ncbi:unnamed protein product [Adineta ricciae]|uniref:Mono(ADP-ribosyl)transferase n=1 Tax=Adineta ricciae TaxID=249248 RepID=A0A815SER2_ADIRI|nr:unnamed protein product [Adineta ricciae]CAF1491254.1 unnamed protein product [Adineta ricciae]
MAERIIPERFLDANEEPNQALTPLEGYEKCPLVSLKEAVQSIKPSIHNWESMVEVAKRNCRNPANGLTQDESGAIYLYTMQCTLKSWFAFLKLFFTALYKLPSIKGVIYRGVKGNLTDKYVEEDHFWWGMSSCTETMNVMENFIGTEDIRTIFIIECENGKSIRLHSYFEEENEILLLSETYFQVKGKWKAADNLYMIQLREKSPPYATITPPFDNSLTMAKEFIDSSLDSCSSSECTGMSSVSYSTTLIENDIHDWSSNKKILVGYSSCGAKDVTDYFPKKESPIVMWPGVKTKKSIAQSDSSGNVFIHLTRRSPKKPEE